MAEWERKPGEPMLWFGRFDKYYRPMGTERSVLGAYNTWRQEKARRRKTGIKLAKSPSATWTANSAKWEWKKRAEAWDAYERELRLAQEEQERQQAREERKALIQKAKGKLETAIKALDPGKPSFSDVVSLARMVFQEERAEYDDLPKQRHEVTGDVGIDLGRRFDEAVKRAYDNETDDDAGDAAE